MYTVTTGKLAIKQQLFLQHYLGADTRLHGNATQCYLKVYGCNLKAAESGGARLLQNVKVKAEIAIHQEKVAEKINVTAETALRDAIRFRDIAFGDLPGIYEHMVKDSETGEHKKITDQLCQFNPQALGKALELIGRNRIVQAFRENVEHTHTHRLELALAAKQKQVEAKAAARPIIDGQAEVIKAQDTAGEAQAVEKAALKRKLELVE